MLDKRLRSFDVFIGSNGHFDAFLLKGFEQFGDARIRHRQIRVVYVVVCFEILLDAFDVFDGTLGFRKGMFDEFAHTVADEHVVF